MSTMANVTSGVLLAKTSPAFLHANSTSHTWVFSAIAELIDNAYDPDVHASVLRIDVEHVLVGSEDVTCITFTDNGAGMAPDKLHNMLSFGYCEKVEMNGYKPVGQYGNGFKSGSMRIGRDAIVFTKDATTLSVGLLSQTFLENIHAETILVPILSWDRKTMQMLNKSDTGGSLRSIRGHSIFRSTVALLKEFEHIIFETGTRIIIYNLKRGLDGKFELDFESDQLDIINSEHHEMDAVYRPVVDYTPEYRRSLRDYCSILFLKPRMKIILREKKMRSKLISHSLKRMQVDTYKPRFLAKPVKIIFGFSPTQDYGIILYHHNRLIKAYEKVGCQKQNSPYSSSVVGIVGVVEADFLEPIHNKQEFDKTDRYNSFLNALGQKLNDYREFLSREDGLGEGQSFDTMNERELYSWTWAQCDRCNKWRRLPPGCDEDLPDVWFCYMNRDPAHNRCDIDEEPEDEDAIMQQSANYTKIVKKHKNMELIEKTQKKKDQEQTTETSTRADLEQAKLQLEEAQRREADQLRIIQMLERENRQWKDKQKQLSNGIMSNSQCMANLNDIARHGTTSSPRSTPSLVSSAASKLGKRKSSTEISSKSKKSHLTSCGNSTESDEDMDDKESVRSSLVIKLPGKKKQATGNIIVIDDSADSDSTLSDSSDIKPDVVLLNKRANKNRRSQTNSVTLDTATSSPPQTIESTTVEVKPSAEQLLAQQPDSVVETCVVNSASKSPVVDTVAADTAGSASVDVNEQPVDTTNKESAGTHASTGTYFSTSINTPAQSQSRHSFDNCKTEHSAPASVSESHTTSRLPATVVSINQKVQQKKRRTGTSSSVHRSLQFLPTLPSHSLPPRRNVSVQTDGERNAATGDSSVFQTLQTLRANVLRLLKTIVPSLDDFGNLEFVDNVVVEMVRVSDSNAVDGSGDGIKPDEGHS